MPPPVPEQLSGTIETLYRSESGRVLAMLVRLLGEGEGRSVDERKNEAPLDDEEIEDGAYAAARVAPRRQNLERRGLDPAGTGGLK